MAAYLRFAVLLLLTGFLMFTTPPSHGSSPGPPGAPVLISPISGALMDNGCKPNGDGITWDFDWSTVGVADVARYHLKVWINPAQPFINKMNIPSSSFHYVSAPSDHIVNTNRIGWRWKVRASIGGIWGPWSKVRSFRVEKLNTDCP